MRPAEIGNEPDLIPDDHRALRRRSGDRPMTHPVPVPAHEWEHLDREGRERDEARERARRIGAGG